MQRALTVLVTVMVITLGGLSFGRAEGPRPTASMSPGAPGVGLLVQNWSPVSPGRPTLKKPGVPLRRIPAPAHSLPEPVAEYLFNGTASDTSANANHAVVTGALPTEDRNGNENSAYIFYERAHRIRVPRSTANTFTGGSFTVSFWVETRDTGEVLKGIITNRDSSGPLWGFNLASGGKIHFQLKNQEDQSAFIIHPIGDGAWHQVTGIRDAAANTMSLYVDGHLIQTRPGVAGNLDSGADIWVGDHMNRLFVGRIDDIRLWDTALGEDDLALLHARGEAPAQTASPAAAETPGIPAPVARYTFDGSANDSSGNNNHGLVTGAEPVEDRTGRPGSAYLFYERPHRIKVPLTAQNTFGTGSFTVSFWIRTFDDNDVLKGIVTNATGATPSWGFHHSAGKVVFLLKNQEGQSSLLAHPVSDGRWHHVTGTRDAGAGTMSLHVDDTLVGTRPAVGGSVNSLGDIHIGDHRNRLFVGRIDDVELWDRAFSPAKLAELHALTAAYTTSAVPDDTLPDPVGIYSFNGGAQDTSALGNHATVTGAHPAADRHGRADGAYCFSERGNRIEIPLVPQNTFSTGSFAVGFWVKINANTPGSPALVTNSRNTSPVWAFTCSAGQLHFHIRDKERQSGGITCRLEPGRWYHVIGVRDAAGGTLSLYVDHQRVGSRPGVAGDVNSGGSIWVGDHSNILLKACIDDVTLWKRALSAQEISALKRAALQAPTPAGVPQGISPVRQRLDRQHVLPRK